METNIIMDTVFYSRVMYSRKSQCVLCNLGVHVKHIDLGGVYAELFSIIYGGTNDDDLG